ncbi:hypothetical protein E5720_17530 [Rhodococcus sp. PAMC28707]|uniref:hypothetical protein n=1 Tax=unclassified Rhodococcus (in: high G+C Gram-positive bacteria) TaxID=192944 RepID=UPI00109DAF73|nr:MULTISPECIES: hypothetical protein [unclassified Rhodococcus (in: high G+C Gram-positive bacteria)]QCB51811.1 hypothetical protein E5769_17990 [Rhodococcus sp. PAMC28705]QCB60020.1 hypothetical protein E5720_17530 [Rhodococcus sp. PAMC28707]
MARNINADDPYELSLLQYRDTGILQIDAPYRESALPDGRVLTAWTSRAQLTPELYEYVEERLELNRDSLHFPRPVALSEPAFHGYVAWPNLEPETVWQFAPGPEQLAADLRREHGVTMPASMRHDLYADATLAHYGDLHVEHLGAVLHMEALRRDTAALQLREPTERAMTAGSHLAALEDYSRVLIDDLAAGRVRTSQRGCSPHELIGGQTADWTQEARVQELRTWPGGEHTHRVVDELLGARAAFENGSTANSWDNHDKLYDLEQNFSKNMSRARIDDWRNPSRPPTPPSTTSRPPEIVARTHTVDRGIRREPKPAPTTPPTVGAVQRQQHRIEIAPPALPVHRRPSM